MKKVIAILMVIALTTGVGFAREMDYLESSMSTWKFAGEIKARMEALGEKADVTDLEVELCIRYMDVYMRLVPLATLEIQGVTSTEAPEPQDLSELESLLDQSRFAYKVGAMSGEEIIDMMVDSIS